MIRKYQLCFYAILVISQLKFTTGADIFFNFQTWAASPTRQEFKAEL